MVSRRGLRRLKRGAGRWLRWLRWELPLAPAREIYGRRQSRHAIAQHRQAQIDLEADPGAASKVGLGAAAGPWPEIPRRLWIYWGQGEAQAPELVRRCIASWREQNPGWEIRVLDATSAAELVDLSDIAPGLAFRLKSDALRLRLLARYGGVWADATSYCHRPLDDWMPLLGGLTGFFTFAAPGRDRWIANWFIAAAPGGVLITRWCAAYDRYVTRLRHMPTVYFMMIYAFQWALLRDPALMAEFRRQGGLVAGPAFTLMAHLEGRSGPEAARAALAAGYPVSKLSWKSKIPETELLTRLAAFLETPGSGPDQCASKSAI